MRSVFYLVDWLPPDFGAVGQYGMVFAREMAEAGQNVVLIGLTSGAASVQAEEFVAGGRLEIRRLPGRQTNKASNFGRLLWAIRTNFRLIRTYLSDLNSYRSELIFTGSPAFMLFFAVPAKWIRSARLRYASPTSIPK